MEDRSANSSRKSSSSASTCFVLYTLVGEDAFCSGSDRHPNAFRLFYQEGNPISLEDVLSQFPLGRNFHFSFKSSDNNYIDIVDPHTWIPMSNSKIIAKVIPLEKVSDMEPIHIPAQEKELKQIPIREKVKKVSKPTKDDSKHSKESIRRRPLEETVAYKISSSGSPQPPQNEPKTHAYETKRSSLNTTSALPTDRQSKNSSNVPSFTQISSMEDAAVVAKKTASKAKKWGGKMLSSLTSSIANASSALRNETTTVGKTNVMIQRLIAEGAMSQIYYVRHVETNEKFAMKQILCQSEEAIQDVETEIYVHQSVHHPNIIPLIDVGESTNPQSRHRKEFLLLFPLYEQGSLWDLIHRSLNDSNPWPFDEMEILRLGYNIGKAIWALHYEGWTHRDIKPHNILLETNGNPILMDLGSVAPIKVQIQTSKQARMVAEEAASKSSAPYRAPELFEVNMNTTIDGKVDVWAFGCLLYCLAFGWSPFESPREGFMKLACLNGTVMFPKDTSGRVRHRQLIFSEEFCQLIEDMLEPNPLKRPSIEDVVDDIQDLRNEEDDEEEDEDDDEEDDE